MSNRASVVPRIRRRSLVVDEVLPSNFRMVCANHVDVSEGVRPCARCRGPFCGDCVVTIQGLPYCATCKAEKLLDVQSGTDASVLQLATIGRRFAANLIDSCIVSIPIFTLLVCSWPSPRLARELRRPGSASRSLASSL